MLVTLLFSLEITLPIAIVVILGVYFKHLGWINEAFNQSASKLVFNVGLPALLFINIINADTTASINWLIILYGAGYTVASFILLSVLSLWVTAFREERGVFVQGAFRGNMGIIGIAFCISAFGDDGATLSAIYLAVLSLLYNILAVVTLNRWATQRAEGSPIVSSVVSLAKNPLIISITLAAVWRFSGIPVPSFLLGAGKYMAQMTLPVALLSIGATLSWSGFVSAGKVTAWATVLKLVLLPYGAATIGYLIGFRDLELGVMYLMMATPTAAASYMMVRAMGGNASLAASIIAITTVASLVTTSLGLAAMRAWGWI